MTMERHRGGMTVQQVPFKIMQMAMALNGGVRNRVTCRDLCLGHASTEELEAWRLQLETRTTIPSRDGQQPDGSWETLFVQPKLGTI